MVREGEKLRGGKGDEGQQKGQAEGRAEAAAVSKCAWERIKVLECV
jgi:hypothetical protein